MATFLSILGFLGIPIGIYLSSLVFRGAQTGWAWAWLGVYVLFDFAALWASTEPRRARVCAAAGGFILAIVLAGRLRVHHQTSVAKLVVLPGERAASWTAGLGEEADIAGMGFVGFADFGAISHLEVATARGPLAAAYRRLRADPSYGPVATPTIPTMLGMPSESAFPTVVLNAPAVGEQRPRAVVLLHGLGGGLVLPCWMLARVMPDAVVICPSIGFGADWNSETGYQAYNSTVAYAQERSGAVYVVGMSSGATGLEALISRNQLGHVAGAVLLSGYEEAGFDGIRRSEIPVLIIRGDHDPRTPPFDQHGLASLDHVQILEVPGGHYVYLEQQDTVLAAMDDFCAPR